MASKSNKIAVFSLVDCLPFPVIIMVTKEKKHVQMFSKGKFGFRSNEI